jgi:hypothetical protein
VPAGHAAGTPSVQYDPMGQGSWKDWYRARAGLVDGIVKNPGVASSGAGVPWKVQVITLHQYRASTGQSYIAIGGRDTLSKRRCGQHP